MYRTAISQRRMTRRSLLVSAAAMTCGMAFTACSTNQAASTDSTLTTNKYTIALIVGAKSDPFYITMRKGAQARATELGVTLLADGPAIFSAQEQIPLVNAMVAKGVNAIMIAACDKQALIQPLQQAHNRGIKIISVDTFIGDGNYTSGSVTFPLSYIGSDNVEGGRIEAAAIIKAIGGVGKVYIQNTSPGASTSEQRVLGCKEAINATNGAVTLVKVDYNYHDVAKASAETLAILQQMQDLVGIIATNLGSGDGAALGVKLANRQGRVKIADFDATEQAITDIRNGVIDLTVAQKPREMGRVAVEYALTALNGDTATIKKRYPTDFVIIDKNNIDTPDTQAAIYQSS